MGILYGAHLHNERLRGQNSRVVQLSPHIYFSLGHAVTWSKRNLLLLILINNIKIQFFVNVLIRG